MIRTAAVLLLATLLAAGDAPPIPPGAVAVVGGQPITLARLELDLLRREGSDAVVQWVASSLETIDWAAMADDAVVMQVGGHQLRKRELVTMLLKSKGAQVREEMVSIAIVEQAVAKEGVVVDDRLLGTEYRLMERSFQRKRNASGQGYLDFGSFLRVKEHMDAEQFLAQPAVRMLAGVHELVRRKLAAEWDDARLQAKLDAEHARWDQRAGVDLAVIHIPWRKNAQGQVTDEEKVRLQGVANLIWRQISAKDTTFAKAWEAFGKSWESSGPDGRIGWVDRDGGREDPAARRIPAKLVERAFAVEGQLPQLLPPCVHEEGVDIAMVHAKRPPRPVTLAEVRTRMFEDILETVLEERTAALVSELRKAAAVEYASLPDLISSREKTAQP